MKKILIIIAIFMAVFLCGTNNIEAFTMSNLRYQLKVKLGEEQPDFPDSILAELIRLSYNAVASHGLAYTNIEDLPRLQSGKSRYFLAPNVLFVIGLINISGGKQTALTEINLKDLGRQQIKTTTPAQFFSVYRHHDSTFIYIYPTPTNSDTLRTFYYRSWYSVDNAVINEAYEEVIIDYALHLAHIRKRDWQSVADTYNEFSKDLMTLRALVINRPVDIRIIPKEIE